jgi:preprotein translocase subunit SecG
MYVLLTILIVIAAVLLILLVLVQNSKGGGLAAGFSGGNQVMGAPRTADFLEKASWTLAAIIIALSIIAVGVSTSNKGTKVSKTLVAKSQTVNKPKKASPTVPTAGFDAQTTQPVEEGAN